jgi:carbonic anhydrase
MDILRPGYERVKSIGSREEQITALEREGVLVSLENLMSFPFVREAVEGETMSIHGLWNDIGDGSLFYFDPEHADWRPVE